MSVEVKDLVIRFKNGTTAVNKVTLTIENGVYGLLGENGAGKTTLMRVLATLLQPSEGKVFINKVEYNKKNNENIQRKIGYLPQELGLYPNLTVRESLEYMGKLSGLSKSEYKERIDYYLEKTSLSTHQKKKNSQLSGGMKRRVGLIQALLNNPEFLIIDEPTTGLDPEERIRIRNLIVEFSRERIVLFSTHVVEDLAATCNCLAIMKQGKIVYKGTISELIKSIFGCVWLCNITDEKEVQKIAERYLISSKQYTEKGLQIKLISKEKPTINSIQTEVTLEDAYIFVTNEIQSKK